MNVHVERARMLLELNRLKEAEAEVRRGLAAEPDNAILHSWLALCRLDERDFPQALESAQAAIGLEPENDYCYYVLSRVHGQQAQFKRALESIREALRLSPFNADYHFFVGVIQFDWGHTREALAAANEGLSHYPQHVDCANLRAMAQAKLGQRAEAAETLQQALSDNPEYYWSHENTAWIALRRGDVQNALIHFRETLRLNPQQDSARRGLIEALKARNRVYRVVLWLFAGQIGDRLSNVLMRGLGVVSTISFILSLIFSVYEYYAGHISAASEFLRIVFGMTIGGTAVLMVYYLLTFLVYHLFGWSFFVGMLRFDRLGRMALTREEIQQADAVIAGIGCATIFVIIAVVMTDGRWLIGSAVAMTLTIVTTYLLQPKHWRLRMLRGTLVVIQILYWGPTIGLGVGEGLKFFEEHGYLWLIPTILWMVVSTTILILLRRERKRE